MLWSLPSSTKCVPWIRCRSAAKKKKMSAPQKPSALEIKENTTLLFPLILPRARMTVVERGSDSRVAGQVPSFSFDRNSSRFYLQRMRRSADDVIVYSGKNISSSKAESLTNKKRKKNVHVTLSSFRQTLTQVGLEPDFSVQTSD